MDTLFFSFSCFCVRASVTINNHIRILIDGTHPGQKGRAGRDHSDLVFARGSRAPDFFEVQEIILTPALQQLVSLEDPRIDEL